MQNWKDLYTELCTKLQADVPAIKWLDLWHNQVNFLGDEHPFSSPAVFLDFRILETTDSGEKVQGLRLQVDTYIFYETFADTYLGSWNQESALSFLDIINDVFACLHGTSGENYSEMRRIGFNPVDTGGAGNLYQQSFECTLMDYAAMKAWEDATGNEIGLAVGDTPAKPQDDYYEIDI